MIVTSPDCAFILAHADVKVHPISKHPSQFHAIGAAWLAKRLSHHCSQAYPTRPRDHLKRRVDGGDMIAGYVDVLLFHRHVTPPPFDRDAALGMISPVIDRAHLYTDGHKRLPAGGFAVAMDPQLATQDMIARFRKRTPIHDLWEGIRARAVSFRRGSEGIHKEARI